MATLTPLLAFSILPVLYLLHGNPEDPAGDRRGGSIVPAGHSGA